MATVTFLSQLLAVTCFHILFVPGSFTLDPCNITVNVDLNLQNNGFHRKISYVLTFVNNYDEILTGKIPEHCLIILEQKLPPGIYYRPDDVDQFRSKEPVNVEDSAEESKALMYQMVRPLRDWTMTINFMLHARYHAANAYGGKKRNILEAPKIYVNCKDEKLVCNKHTNDSVTKSFCKKDAPCTWTELPIHVEPNKLTWDVPVGNTQDYHVVAVGTTFAVVAGSIYLLWTIHDYMLNKQIKIKNE